MKNILDEIEDSLPYESGLVDAANEAPFCPEYFWARPEDKAKYAQGFLSVKPDNAAALSFTGQTFYSRLAEMRAADLAVDEAQYTPSPGYDF